jgi:hypothetical protein
MGLLLTGPRQQEQQQEEQQTLGGLLAGLLQVLLLRLAHCLRAALLQVARQSWVAVGFARPLAAQ